MVEEAFEDMKKEKNTDSKTETGEWKLKPIFDSLDGEVNYTDIKLSLIFLK